MNRRRTAAFPLNASRIGYAQGAMGDGDNGLLEARNG